MLTTCGSVLTFLGSWKLLLFSQVDKSLGLNKEGKFDSQDADWTGFHLQQALKPIRNQRQASREDNKKDTFQSQGNRTAQAAFSMNISTDNDQDKEGGVSARVDTRVGALLCLLLHPKWRVRILNLTMWLIPLLMLACHALEGKLQSSVHPEASFSLLVDWAQEMVAPRTISLY